MRKQVRYSYGPAERVFTPYAGPEVPPTYRPARFIGGGRAGIYTTERGLARIIARETDPTQWGDRYLTTVTTDHTVTVYFYQRGAGVHAAPDYWRLSWGWSV